MHRIRITCLAIVLAAGTACAGVDNAGTTAGNFLSVGTGASVLAMGGATLGAGDDLHAAAWNPAALARLGSAQITLSHATLAQLSAQDLAAAGGRLGAGATRWGASVLYQGDGSFDGRDALGVPTGAFNVSSMAVGVQLARPLGNAVTAGLGARWLSDNLGDARGSGMAFDFGLQARTGPLGLGFAARNVGGSLAYPSGRFDLPAVFGVGASWSDAVHGLRLALDANLPRAYYNDVRIGGEWRWQDRVALRAGYRMELGAPMGEPLGGPSFGMGAGTNSLWMDYAFLAGNADAQGQHRLALTFHSGIRGGKLRPVDETRVPETRVVGARESEVNATPGVDATFPLDLQVLLTEAWSTSVSETDARDAGASVTQVASAEASATPEPLVAMTVAPAPRTLSVLEQLAFDVSDRLPAGGSESESFPREIIPLHVLAASPPVRVEPLAIGKLTGSNTDAQEDKERVAAQPKAKPPAVVRSAATRTAIARSATPRPAVAPPVVAPPAAARATIIPPASASSSAAAVAVAPPAAAPRVATPVVVAPRAVAPRVVPRVAPALKPETPAVITPVAAPKPEATPVAAPEPSAPESVPAAPAPTPEPAKPVKTSPWPSVSAAMPRAQFAGSSPKVVVVGVPADAPSTAPITRLKSIVRPAFVLARGDDTLADIARQWDTSVPALMMENNLVNTRLKSGQKLVLPPPLH